MKKMIILVVFLLFSGNYIVAQRFYLRAGLGTSVSTSDYRFTNTNFTFINDLIVVETSEAVLKGFGSGLPFDFSIGYKARNYFGIDLGINYFNGFKIKYSESYPTIFWYEKASARMVSLVPALTFNLSLKKFNPYARIGLMIGILNKIVYEYHGEITSSESSIDAKYEDYGSNPVGAQFAFGTDYIINDHISFFIEVQMDGISFSPGHGKYTKFEVDGEDRLWEFSIKESEVDYVSYIDYDEQIPDDSPDKKLKFCAPLNNVGLLIGIKAYLIK